MIFHQKTKSTPCPDLANATVGDLAAASIRKPEMPFQHISHARWTTDDVQNGIAAAAGKGFVRMLHNAVVIVCHHSATAAQFTIMGSCYALLLSPTL